MLQQQSIRCRKWQTFIMTRPRVFRGIVIVTIIITLVLLLYLPRLPIAMPKLLSLSSSSSSSSSSLISAPPLKSANRTEPKLLLKLKQRLYAKRTPTDSTLSEALQSKRLKRTYVCSINTRTPDLLLRARNTGANCVAMGLYYYPSPVTTFNMKALNPECQAPWFFGDMEMFEGYDKTCSSVPCRPWSAGSFLQHFATNSYGLLLLVIHTTWSEYDSAESQEKCAHATKKMLAHELFLLGYAGDVFFTVPDSAGDPFLRILALDVDYPYASHIFVGYGKNVRTDLSSIKRLRSLSTRVGAMGPYYIPSVGTGALLEDSRVISLNGVGDVLDTAEEVKHAIIRGADVIFTRKTHVAVGVLNKMTRAIPHVAMKDLPSMTQPYLSASQRSAGGFQLGECRCAYYFDNNDDRYGGRVDGCVIRLAAPAGKACYCERLRHQITNRPLRECKGHTVLCPDLNNLYCHDPDVTLASCQFAEGDCGGYSYWGGNWDCDCKYKKGGCVVSKPAPPNGACRCVLKGPLTCQGIVTFCKDPDSDQCVKPDTSLASCLAAGAGANCKGYVI